MSQSHRLLSLNALKPLALGLVSLFVLSGCAGSSSDESPSAAAPKSSASITASPTPSPTPTGEYKPASAKGPAENVQLPELPEAAKKETKEGLIAFAKYWFDTVEYAYQTGDLDPFRSANSTSCIGCDYVYSLVGQGYENTDWLQGGEFEIHSMDTPFKKLPSGHYQVMMHLSQKGVISHGPGGKIYSKIEGAGSVVQLFEARYANGEWTTLRLESVK